MGRKKVNRIAETPPAIVALRAWREAERRRREESALREKERLRRQLAADKRKARAEQDAALYDIRVDRALAHTRGRLGQDETSVVERIDEITARRLISPGSLGVLALTLGLLVTPTFVVDWFQHHKVSAEYALMIALGYLFSMGLSALLCLLWCEIWLGPWLCKGREVAEAQAELVTIARKRERLDRGDYQVIRPKRLYQPWSDTPLAIRFG